MSSKKKHLALALQGGGSHGAITWGVLDRLLQEPSIELDGFSGTSAGAMNATVLAWGLHKGGNEAAREYLFEFWKKVADLGRYSPFKPSWFDQYFGAGNMDFSPAYLSSEFWSLFFSPYQFNPLNYNPLRDVIDGIVDFEQLRKCTVTKLFVCATNVRKGRAKVFTLDDISVDAVMASACLPYLFKAVTIEGEDYWDGGFMGNPPIYPLIDGGCKDIMLVQINPINIDKTPTTSVQIKDRINELSFNSTLMLEMRRIAFIDKLVDQGITLDGKLKEIFVHYINPEVEVQNLNVSSKLNTNWDFLSKLFEIGRKYADVWLQENYDKIGVETTIDLHETFL
ncbi:MAG: patatin-like phospholipase family protein [Bacteroidota bacterium]